MAMVRVVYRRTFQTRPYETQVVELGIEGETVAEVLKEATPEKLRQMAQAYASLDKVGDDAMVKALAKPDPGGRR